MKQEGEKGRRTFEDGSREVIAALIEVHECLGPGLLESTYQACVARELMLRGIPFEQQRAMSVRYKGATLETGYRIDFIVRGDLIVELKAVERLLPVHVAQVVTYLKLSRVPAALLVNFNVRLLRDGIKRLWTSPEYFSSSPLLVKRSARRG